MGGGGGGEKGPEKGYRGLGRESDKFYYDITKIFRFPPTPLAVKKMTCSQARITISIGAPNHIVTPVCVSLCLCLCLSMCSQKSYDLGFLYSC